MRFTIHDVGHGFCAHFQHDNGNVMLWDAGHKPLPEIRPSYFLRSQGITVIHYFFVTNYDEDHISDLPSLRDSFEICILTRNKSIDAGQLLRLKLASGPITPAMSSLLSMIDTYTHPVSSPPDFSRIEWTTFSNRFQSDFNDTNNLSLVTFLHSPVIDVVIPGDLETAGWLKLLENARFRQHLQRTKVFIASHHGRESGYCNRVFDYCSPEVVVFSDSRVKHATQEMANTYGRHASGITFNGRVRSVLSTRADGTLYWST